MAHVDGLSRLTVGAITVLSLPRELLIAGQTLDRWVETTVSQERDDLRCEDGVWKKRLDGEPARPWVPLIPNTLRDWYLAHCHEHQWAGHPGVETTLKVARRFGWWKHMARDTEDFVKRCSKCQQRNTPNRLNPPIQRPEIPSRVGQIVGIDFVGPLPGRHSTKHILTVVDHYSKHAEAYITNDCTAATTARILTTKYIPSYGAPEQIVSDRGTAFTSRLMQELCETWEIRHIRTSAYHPQANGVCERFHRTLANVIAKVQKDDN